jgi:hypothetical protein
LWLFLIYLVAMVSGASAQTRGEVPTLETIIARMAQARAENQARFRPYTVTRDYKVFGKERDKTKSQVISDVIFVPPDLKDYAIQRTNGTGRLQTAFEATALVRIVGPYTMISRDVKYEIGELNATTRAKQAPKTFTRQISSTPADNTFIELIRW